MKDDQPRRWASDHCSKFRSTSDISKPFQMSERMNINRGVVMSRWNANCYPFLDNPRFRMKIAWCLEHHECRQNDRHVVVLCIIFHDHFSFLNVDKLFFLIGTCSFGNQMLVMPFVGIIFFLENYVHWIEASQPFNKTAIKSAYFKRPFSRIRTFLDFLSRFFLYQKKGTDEKVKIIKKKKTK